MEPYDTSCLSLKISGHPKVGYVRATSGHLPQVDPSNHYEQVKYLDMFMSSAKNITWLNYAG